jgi:hypothetical protein
MQIEIWEQNLNLNCCSFIFRRESGARTWKEETRFRVPEIKVLRGLRGKNGKTSLHNLFRTRYYISYQFQEMPGACTKQGTRKRKAYSVLIGKLLRTVYVKILKLISSKEAGCFSSA